LSEEKERKSEKNMSEYFIRDGKSYFKLSSGKEIEIKKVSPLTLQAAITTIPKPTPPMQDILDVNTGKVIGVERNESHPDYQQDLTDYQVKIREITVKTTLLLAVKTEVDKKAVVEMRDEFRDATGAELDPNDKYVYISSILIQDSEDLEKLLEAVTARSQPTEGAVATAIEQFRPDVQG
jgi:hypothetical protein